MFLKKNSLRFFSYGELRYKLVSDPYQNHPSVTGLYYNNSKYCLESEQPSKSARQYVRAIITTIRERDYNVDFTITTDARDDILSEMSTRIPAGGQGQLVGVEPQPHQGRAGVGVEGQPQPEQLSSLAVGAAHQPTGVETHPDQEAAGSSVSAQHHQEPPAAGPAGGQGQLVGVEARPDQGRAGAGGDGQSDRPTPPVNRGATPRAQVSDPAHTLVTGRGGGGGGGVFGGAGRGGYQAPFPGQRNFVPGHQAPFPAGHSLPGHQAPFTGQWQWSDLPGHQAPFTGQWQWSDLPGHQALFPAGHLLPGHQAPFPDQWSEQGSLVPRRGG